MLVYLKIGEIDENEKIGEFVSQGLNLGNHTAALALIISIMGLWAPIIAVMIFRRSPESINFYDIDDDAERRNLAASDLSESFWNDWSRLDDRESGRLDKEDDTKNDDQKDTPAQQETFVSYFKSIVNKYDIEIDRANKKSSLLLTKGIRIMLISMVLYISIIVISQYVFYSNGFETYNIAGLISITILFLFAQVVGGWYLKQYKYFIDVGIYYQKLKTNIQRYYMVYLAEHELSEDEKNINSKLLEILSTQFADPETYIAKTNDTNPMKEALASYEKLGGIFK